MSIFTRLEINFRLFQRLFWNYKYQLKSKNRCILLSTKTTKIMQVSFSEFTDSQWQFIDKIIDDQRKRKHNLRVIVNAIFQSITLALNGGMPPSVIWIVNIHLGKLFSITLLNLNSEEYGKTSLIQLFQMSEKGKGEMIYYWTYRSFPWSAF